MQREFEEEVQPGLIDGPVWAGARWLIQGIYAL